jgi:excisionase family DNA binding protein
MPSDIATLTLHDVADELGVHYMTAYRYVRLGYLDAVKAGRQWQVTRTELDRFRNQPIPEPEEEAPWADRLLARMLAGDQTGSFAVAEAALASGNSPTEVYIEVIGPALREVGARWERGEITVGDEHMATAVATRLIGRLGPRFVRRGQSKATVVAGTPPGERHALGIEMTADILRGSGYEVLSLGADVPVASYSTAVSRVDDLAAVCLSVVAPADGGALRDLIAAIKSERPVPVIVGGPGIDGATALAAGADAYSVSALEVAALIDRARADS